MEILFTSGSMSNDVNMMKIWLRNILHSPLLLTMSCCFILSLQSCQKSPDSQGGTKETSIPHQNIRQSVIAGSWYPGDAGELSSMVDEYLSKVPEGELNGELVALIAPHAGYRYSGSVAAYAHALLRDSGVRTVVLLGPSHRHSFRGFSIHTTGGYRTPLGVVPVNTKLTEELVSSSDLISQIPEAHQAEHSIEIQLPFLQRILTQFDFVPIVVGPFCTFDDCADMAETLVDHFRQEENVIFIASSDMSHYPTYDGAVKVDQEMLAAVKSFDIQRIVQTDAKIMGTGIKNLSCTFCGLKPVLITMMAAHGLGADAVKILKYANSGDTPFGERDRVVGYGAVAVYKSEMRNEKMEFEPLNEEAQRSVLRIAREAIETNVRTGRASEYEPGLPVLNEKRGVFVTITKHGMLRGCIGYHGNDIPLYRLVPDRAVAAAVKDARFPPLSEDELDDVKVKVSIYLTNVYRIDDLDEFELGKHGIIMRKGGRGATYLPEVPVEAGWTKEEEMEHLCRKAGLPSGAWREGAEFYVYATQVFGEK